MRLRQHPVPNDVSFEEFVKFLTKNGFVYKTNKASHYQYVYRFNGLLEIIGFKKPHSNSDGIEEPYIEKALEAVDRIRDKIS